jgi:hypothetical protein
MACGRFAGIITVGKHNHVADVVGQIKGAQSRGGEGRPGGPVGCLHGRKAGFYAFADHQHVAQHAKPHCATTARAEHHLRRVNRRLAAAVVGEEGAVDGQRLVVEPACH